MKLNIFLQAAQRGFDYQTLIFLGLMFFVLYFFMIRPQQKKKKEADKFRESLKRGDEVTTIGGIMGVISSVEPDSILVEVDKGVKIQVQKWGISADSAKKVGEKK